MFELSQLSVSTKTGSVLPDFDMADHIRSPSPGLGELHGELPATRGGKCLWRSAIR